LDESDDTSEDSTDDREDHSGGEDQSDGQDGESAVKSQPRKMTITLAAARKRTIPVETMTIQAVMMKRTMRRRQFW